MADEAGVAPDQVLDQILATTASIRPRPRLWAVVVEPRMRSRTMPVAVGIANRRLVLAVVLAILAVALAAAVAGASLLLNRIPSDTAADWPGLMLSIACSRIIPSPIIKSRTNLQIRR